MVKKHNPFPYLKLNYIRITNLRISYVFSLELEGDIIGIRQWLLLILRHVCCLISFGPPHKCVSMEDRKNMATCFLSSNVSRLILLRRAAASRFWYDCLIFSGDQQISGKFSGAVLKTIQVCTVPVTLLPSTNHIPPYQSRDLVMCYTFMRRSIGSDSNFWLFLFHNFPPFISMSDTQQILELHKAKSYDLHYYIVNRSINITISLETNKICQL